MGGERVTFTITGKDEEQFGSTTILRCDVCGTSETVYDRPFDDAAMDEAERIHQHVVVCVHCDEPMSFGVALSDEPNAIPVHRQCFEDDRPGVRESIMAYLEKQEAA